MRRNIQLKNLREIAKNTMNFKGENYYGKYKNLQI